MAADDIDSLESELDDLEEGGARQKLMRFMPVIAGIGLLLFVGIVMVAYSGGGDDTATKVATPVLTPEGTTKIEPETPGGMDIPDQDKLVYNQLNQGAAEGTVENILPPPEQPLTPPGAAPDQVDTSTLVPPAPGEPVLPTVPQTPAPAGAPETPAATAQPAPGTAPATAPKPGSQTAILKPPAAPGATEPAAAGAPTSDSKSTAELRTHAGVYRIQLASVQSQAQAEKAWDTHVRQYGDLLSKLTLTVQRAVIQDRGTYYRVQAGPFEDRDSADAVCRKLKKNGVDCLVVRP